MGCAITRISIDVKNIQLLDFMEKLHAIYEVANIERKKHPDKSILDANRQTLEPYIYMYLMESYGPMLEAHWKTYVPPKKSENVFMIAERRAHPNFRFILQNIAWAGPDMAVYLFCSDENLAFIEALLGDKKVHFHIIPVFIGNPDREQGKISYNNLLTDYRFYQRIDANYVLTVQMDNIFRKKIDPLMFVGDYWGNPWHWKPSAPGGGGATVRRINAMIELCRTHRPDPNSLFEGIEDNWFCNHVTAYPDLSFRAQHMMETVIVEDPYILHQFWTFAHEYLHLSRDKFIETWRKLLTIA